MNGIDGKKEKMSKEKIIESLVIYYGYTAENAAKKVENYIGQNNKAETFSAIVPILIGSFE